MKKDLLLLIFLLLTFSSSLLAQHPHNEYKNDIGITAGFRSMMGLLRNPVSPTIRHNPYGNYGLHYYYQVKHWCQVGVKVNSEISKRTIFEENRPYLVSKQDMLTHLSLMPSVRFSYLNRPWVRLYSGVDLGCGYFLCTPTKLDPNPENTISKRLYFAYDVTPIGVEVGRKFYGLVETNIGYDSFVKAGIGFRF